MSHFPGGTVDYDSTEHVVFFFFFLHFSGKTLKTDKAVNTVDKMFNCQPTFVVIIYVMIIIIIHLSINSLFIIKSQSATNENMLR